MTGRSASIEPSLDGAGAIVRITNTGRVAIPAGSSRDASATRDPEARPAISMVTVTASWSGAADGAPVRLLSSPLATDLRPGTSVTIHVPGITAATGRTMNWLSVTLSVLGDPNALAAYLPAGAWLSDPGPSATARADAAAPWTAGPDLVP